MHMTTTSTDTVSREIRTLARCPKCKTMHAGTTEELTTVRDGRTFVYAVPTSIDCACGAHVRLNAVRGIVSEKKCGAGCRHAKGPTCSCECGGEHHGEGWAA
jgi:hypothetical protein